MAAPTDLKHDLNAELAGWGEDGRGPQRPVTLIVGAPRSGGTLTCQLLAATDAFAWPSNLIGRFWRAPALGARIQSMLAPVLPPPEPSFSSSGGTTSGWWGPHDLADFWSEQLRFGADHAHLDPAPSLAPRLGALEREAGRPLLLESSLLCFAVPRLLEALPTARVLWIRRDPLDTALSILRMRARTGMPDAWWSVRPPGAEKRGAPVEQVAYQVRACLEALAQAHAAAPDRVLPIGYEALCEDVQGTFRAVLPEVDAASLPTHFPPTAHHDHPAREAVRVALATHP